MVRRGGHQGWREVGFQCWVVEGGKCVCWGGLRLGISGWGKVTILRVNFFFKFIWGIRMCPILCSLVAKMQEENLEEILNPFCFLLSRVVGSTSKSRRKPNKPTLRFTKQNGSASQSNINTPPYNQHQTGTQSTIPNAAHTRDDYKGNMKK